jgi:hypothetical protein
MKRPSPGISVGLVALAFAACSSLPEERSASARAALDQRVAQEKYQAQLDEWARSRQQPTGQPVMLPPAGYFPDGRPFHNGTITLPNGQSMQYTADPAGNVTFY